MLTFYSLYVQGCSLNMFRLNMDRLRPLQSKLKHKNHLSINKCNKLPTYTVSPSQYM